MIHEIKLVFGSNRAHVKVSLFQVLLSLDIMTVQGYDVAYLEKKLQVTA